MPVPDPSLLTSVQIKESVNNLKGLLETQISALKKDLDDFRQRYDNDFHNTVETAITHRKELSDAQIAILKTQVDAQFDAIQAQITVLATETIEQAKATDLRYEQRYTAQTEARNTAFEAAQLATDSALASQKEAIQIALQTVKEANEKTEIAIDKLMPRLESEARIHDIEQQIERRFNDLMNSIKDTLVAANKSLDVSSDTTEKRFITIAKSLELLSVLSDRISRVEVSITGLDHTTSEKVLTLKTLIDSQGDKIAIAANASEKAIEVAQIASEKRFEVNTGLTAQLSEQSKTFLPRGEFVAVTGALNSKLDDMKSLVNDAVSNINTRLATTAGRASVASPVDSQIADLTREVIALRASRDVGVGRSVGSNAVFGYIALAVGVLSGLIGIFFALTR